MKYKGVSYDVGRVMGGNWRPDYDPKIVHRELEIIKNDLHCNAVRICGLDIDRLMISAEDALKQGLYVWLSPEMWDRNPKETLAYIAKVAQAAEKLNQQYPDRLVLCVGSELTLFMNGIVEGRNVMERMTKLMVKLRQQQQKDLVDMIANAQSAEYNKILNEFLAKANNAVREVFHGKVSYASLLWEGVDWDLFDFVGVDHYMSIKIKDKYIETLRPSFEHKKPVVVTEFGFRTYKGADTSTEGMAGDIMDYKSVFLHHLPVVGLFVRQKLKGTYERDETMQARELVSQLRTLDDAGVEGAFIMTFIAPTTPFDNDPKYDLDMASYSLVKSYSKGKRGTTYSDMTWEPKEAFKAVASYYALKKS